MLYPAVKKEKKCAPQPSIKDQHGNIWHMTAQDATEIDLLGATRLRSSIGLLGGKCRELGRCGAGGFRTEASLPGGTRAEEKEGDWGEWM